MSSRLLPLAMAVTLTLLTACDTMNPKAKMGPDSARYVGSRYRRTFVVEASADVPAPRAATATSDPTGMTGPSGVALAPARSRGRSRTGGPRSVPIPPRRAPATVAEPPTTSHGAAGSVAHRMSAGGTTRPASAATRAPVAARAPTGATAAASTPMTSPAESADRTKRRFLRLKIHGMEPNDTEAPFAVRRMLSTAPGVKEVVLSSKTQTAIVVVDPQTDTDLVRAALEAPYRAEVLQ